MILSKESYHVRMRKHLITGLIILLPLALTIFIISFVVNFLTNPFMGIVSHFLAKTELANRGFLFLSPEQTIKFGSQLIILICLFFVIWFLGIIARWFLVNWILQLGDKILHRVPLINKVYKTTKDIITTLFGQGQNSFKQVVMVPFPATGIYAIGFLSQVAPENCSEAAGEKMHSVFVPTAPNPTTGFVVMYKLNEIRHLEMKVEEAIKYIVSCGMVAPQETHDKEVSS